MKKTYILLSVLLLLTITSGKLFSQGCVAIKSSGGVCTMLDHPETTDANGGWVFSSNSRYYRSYKHYVGTQEQTQRVDLGTNVINHAYTQDLALTKIVNSRWSYAIDVPILGNTRSSLYEHGGTERHSTSSFGLGDVRVGGYFWVLDPHKFKKGNIQFGLGIKLPTGDYKYMDFTIPGLMQHGY
jgi:hypothetical protein